MEIELSPRMVEVVILVGRDRLSYKAAAKELLRKDGEPGRISHHTVRGYAEQVRDRMGVDVPPRDACTRYYWAHRDSLEEMAEAA